MSRFQRGLARMVPMLLVMGVIFFLSSMPGDRLVLPPIVNIDKVAHMAIYGLLALTVFYAFGGSSLDRLHPSMISLLVILICTLYGLSDEFHQSFIPNRSADVFDVLADCIGAIIACIIRIVYTYLRKKKSRSCKGIFICI
jgi:VanZ family protein